MSSSASSPSSAFPTSSATSAPAATPFQRHRAGLRDAKRVLNGLLAAEGGGAAHLPDSEWMDWKRCEQLDVPLAAAPLSLAVSGTAFAGVTALATRLPEALSSSVLSSRGSLAMIAGLMHFRVNTSPASSLSEPCYLHVLAGPSKAGADMRRAYRTQQLPGAAPFADAADAAAAAASASPMGFEQRLSAVLPFIPPASSSAPARRAAAAASDGDASFEAFNFDASPAPEPKAADSALPVWSGSGSGQRFRVRPPAPAHEWQLDYGDAATDDVPPAAALPKPRRGHWQDPPEEFEASYVTRRRKREYLWHEGSSLEGERVAS